MQKCFKHICICVSFTFLRHPAYQVPWCPSGAGPWEISLMDLPLSKRRALLESLNEGWQCLVGNHSHFSQITMSLNKPLPTAMFFKPTDFGSTGPTDEKCSSPCCLDPQIFPDHQSWIPQWSYLCKRLQKANPRYLITKHAPQAPRISGHWVWGELWGHLHAPVTLLNT